MVYVNSNFNKSEIKKLNTLKLYYFNKTSREDTIKAMLKLCWETYLEDEQKKEPKTKEMKNDSRNRKKV